MDTLIPALDSSSLPPLSIIESRPDGLLDPEAARYNLTVKIDFDWQTGDSLTITWAGTPGSGSYTSPRIPIGGFQRPFQTHIDNLLVAFNFEHTVIVTYTVYRGTEPPVTSQPLPLYITRINQLSLPRPFIRQADKDGQGSELNVSDLSEFTLRTNAWLLGRRGQFFWLNINGTNADGSDFEASYWQAPDNVVNDEFNRFGFFEQNFPAAPLQRLQDRSVLSLRFMAGLQGSQDASLAQPFAHRNYIVLTGAPSGPRISSVTDLDGDILDGADTRYTTVTLSGTASDTVAVFDGSTRLDTADVVDGNWRYVATDLTGGSHVFTVRLADGSGSASPPWRINVVIQSLPLTIVEAPDNINLDPLKAITTLTALLDLDLQPTDMVSVTVKAADGTPPAGSHTTTPVPAGTTRPIRISLPVSLVAFSIGKIMEVAFTYTRGASAPVTSQPLHLNVLPIALERLAAPVITQANGTDILDLKDVQSGANLLFGVWPHIAVNQCLWLDLQGESNAGAPNLRMWAGTTNRVHRAWVTNGGYTAIVSANYLRLLKDGSKLIIRFMVNLDQVANSDTAAVFQTREYTIRAVP
ncbi:Ig-like domain repeat protein [Pseudomonas fluorescens]|uniref:Ig-like domain repeat protein n=1 Tax=Pseudomonas fluorescens TaxID=294 RepID=UPI0007D064A7|nr:Ig-like domain repeat protein [Pseudomonas fluorescens]